MSVAFVVPYAPSPERDRAWREIKAALRNDYPSWPIVMGDACEPWSKGLSVAAGVRRLDRHLDTIIVHDADVYLCPDALCLAVEQVLAGAAWAVPHGDVCRLTKHATEELYRGNECSGQLERAAYVGYPGGGIVVLPRAAYEECPIDPRFVGWGDEDASWGWALTALYGEPWRGTEGLVHLWHPHALPGRRYAGHSPLVASKELWRAYRSARKDPARMRALVADARVHAFAA